MISVIWMERNKRIFEDYSGHVVEELWDKVRFWSSIVASVSSEFRDLSSFSFFFP